MLGLGDIVKLLERWDVWRRIEAAPGRIDALEERVAALEAELKRRPAVEACTKCGHEPFKVTDVQPHPSLGDVGVQERVHACDACGHTETRTFDPLGRMGPKKR